MPLIDRTYFETELNIPKTDTVSVQENLDALIVKREPELLQDILGYALYKAFMAGLLLPVVPQIWNDLLLGADYTDRFGHLQRWRGLVSAPPAIVNAVSEANSIPYVATETDEDEQTIPVPPNLVGRPWRLSKRPIGELRPDEYAVDMLGEYVTLTDPIVEDDTYFFYSNDLSLEQTSGSDKSSLIANYVYYWYLRKEASQMSALGDVVTKGENSDINGPGEKMSRAWNEMSGWIREMVCYLDARKTDYVDWRWMHGVYVYDNYGTITRF